MHILIAAATSFELAPFVSQWSNKPGNSKVLRLSFLITGVGQAVTTYALTKYVYQQRPDLIIQAGITGVFGDTFPLGKVVLVKQDTFGDLGMETAGQFSTVFNAGFTDADEPPFTKGWLVNEHPILSNGKWPTAIGVTVNKVSDGEQQYQQLMQHFAPQVESMEGAALHYVCLQENIPFLQVRSISNFVGDRNKANWKMKEAIESLNIELELLLHEISLNAITSIHP